MTMWISSDHHFNHKNIIKYQEKQRPFYSFDAAGEIERDDEDKVIVHRSQVEAMNEALIDNHNRLVGKNDDVFFLGDFAFASADKICEWLSRMNGRKYFIFGNHDREMNDPEVRKHFEWMRHYHEQRVGDDKTKVVMFHFPIHSWHRQHYGAVHLHGHLHCTGVDIGRRFDVGVDGNEMAPYNLEDLVTELRGKEIYVNKYDHHDANR